MFTPEYKAARAECLKIAKEMYYYKMDDPRRAELQKQLEAARAKREEIRRHEHEEVARESQSGFRCGMQ